MLCKEQGITVTGICAIYEIFVAQKVNILLHIFDTIFRRLRLFLLHTSTQPPLYVMGPWHPLVQHQHVPQCCSTTFLWLLCSAEWIYTPRRRRRRWDHDVHFRSVPLSLHLSGDMARTAEEMGGDVVLFHLVLIYLHKRPWPVTYLLIRSDCGTSSRSSAPSWVGRARRCPCGPPRPRSDCLFCA